MTAAALTLAEAAQVLDPPVTERQLRLIVAALRGSVHPVGVRRTGRQGKPVCTYDAETLMRLHAAVAPWLA